jgi:tRNA pseudouridine65 synthase
VEIPVLYEDAYCLIVNKPNNVLVHHSHYARNIEAPSLVELLCEQGVEHPIPVHRLDHKTSGVLLFAKSAEYVKSFQELFEQKAITKTYLALLRGHVPEHGIIDTPVKNERGNYKEALTAYRSIEHYELDFAIPPYSKSRYSLVEFVPKTGRMHQLRIHANKISHPIIGDPKHGNRHHNHYFQQELQWPNLFLHASKLEFTHPFSGEKLVVVAQLPYFWEQFFKLANR